MNKKEILEANKKFYNLTASVYDEADGRRSAKLQLWLEKKLQRLASEYGKDKFLDLGCGTGFVMRCAKPFFKDIIGLDISSKMLLKAKKYGRTVCADLAKIPFPKESFNVVVSFATLHHCYQTQEVFQEIFQVLKKGGCFYADHDLENHFVKNFGLLLFLYRLLRNPGGRYLNLTKGLSKSLYEKTEYHSKGLDALKIEQELKKAGFLKINLTYHWFGLNPLTDWIFKQKTFKLGWAPLLAIEAKKI